MKYRFLLFDADNTLLDFTACEAKAFAEALKLCGIPQKPGMTEVYSAYNDRCWKELERGELTKPQLVVKRYALFLEHYGIDKDPQTVNETYADCLSKTAIELPGAEDLLKRLYGKAKIYIITNGLTKVQKGRFARTGMTEYIEEIFISEQMGCKKPDALFFSLVAERIPGFCQEQAIVIGDSLTSDIRGANNAGLPCCWFNPGNIPRPADLRIDYEIADLRQLLRIV